jgi:YHS domain-containing protein
MAKKILTCSFPVLATVILAGCASTGQLVELSKSDYGLDTYSSFNGEPLTIGSKTLALEYNNRIFYFHNNLDLNKFQNDPDNYILKYEFNESPVISSPLTSDYGLQTHCSYDDLPIVVTKYTPTLRYLGRFYYFAHKETRALFLKDPQKYVAKFPANKPPKIISPLKSDYGTKTDCAATGVPLLVGPHTPTLEYLGRVFYFSNLSGMQVFKEDPQAYITKKFNKG